MDFSKGGEERSTLPSCAVEFSWRTARNPHVSIPCLDTQAQEDRNCCIWGLLTSVPVYGSSVVGNVVHDVDDDIVAPVGLNGRAWNRSVEHKRVSLVSIRCHHCPLRNQRILREYTLFSLFYSSFLVFFRTFICLWKSGRSTASLTDLSRDPCGRPCLVVVCVDIVVSPAMPRRGRILARGLTRLRCQIAPGLSGRAAEERHASEDEYGFTKHSHRHPRGSGMSSLSKETK